MYILSFDVLNDRGYRETAQYLIDDDNRTKIIGNYGWLRFTNVDNVYVEMPRARVIGLTIAPYTPPAPPVPATTDEADEAKLS